MHEERGTVSRERHGPAGERGGEEGGKDERDKAVLVLKETAAQVLELVDPPRSGTRDAPVVG